MQPEQREGEALAQRLRGARRQAEAYGDRWLLGVIEAAYDALAASQEKERQLREALRRYGAHERDCRMVAGSYCECGLSARLAALDSTQTHGGSPTTTQDSEEAQ